MTDETLKQANELRATIGTLGLHHKTLLDLSTKTAGEMDGHSARVVESLGGILEDMPGTVLVSVIETLERETGGHLVSLRRQYEAL